MFRERAQVQRGLHGTASGRRSGEPCKKLERRKGQPHAWLEWAGRPGCGPGQASRGKMRYDEVAEKCPDVGNSAACMYRRIVTIA